jgi:integrase
MSSTRKRGNYYYARWRTADGSQGEKGGFGTRKEAELFAKEKEVEASKGLRTKPSYTNQTISQFAQEIWRHTLIVREQTLLDYKRSLDSHIYPAFAEIPMNQINQADLLKFRADLVKKGLSPRTVEKHLNLMAAIMKTAIRAKVIQDSPFDGWKRGKAETKNKVSPLTHDQLVGISNNLPPQYRLIVWLGVYTGMRPSEMLGLSWDRIDFEKKIITVDRQLSTNTSEVWTSTGLKTYASRREIGMSSELEGLILNHYAAFGLSPEGLLFKSRTNKPWRRHDASALFAKAAKKEGLAKGQGMHQLRHTAASILIAHVKNVKAVQAFLGHKSITETMDTYGHLFDDAKDELIQVFDNYAKSNEKWVKLSLKELSKVESN